MIVVRSVRKSRTSTRNGE